MQYIPQVPNAKVHIRPDVLNYVVVKQNKDDTLWQLAGPFTNKDNAKNRYMEELHTFNRIKETPNKELCPRDLSTKENTKNILLLELSVQVREVKEEK